MKDLKRRIEQVKCNVKLYEFMKYRLGTHYKKGEYIHGLCEFCGEKDMVLSLEKNMYHCHSCFVGGDIVGYVQYRKKMNVAQAVQWLSSLAPCKTCEKQETD